MPQPAISKPGSVQVKKIGHTFDGRFGINPNVQEKGKQSPTEQSFGKGS